MVNSLSHIINDKNRDFPFLSYPEWGVLIQLKLTFTFYDLYTETLSAMAAEY
jgi:hypothetical protein